MLFVLFVIFLLLLHRKDRPMYSQCSQIILSATVLMNCGSILSYHPFHTEGMRKKISKILIMKW